MAYNPAANGMVERAHRSLKAALMARCTDESWKVQLPWVLLGLGTTPKANGDSSPAEKVWGDTGHSQRILSTISRWRRHPLPRLRELAQKFAPCHKTFTDRTTYSPPTLDSCVFVRVDARQPPLTRPYRVPTKSSGRPPRHTSTSTGMKTGSPSTD
ncbi:uncharacterized protein [Macrobrachium rosenbergii]|uniref:uncharacterized protein n=1 Tax=Macrobrachium rosenbergii TaxID=79674 RepID=UPI0034D6BF99